MTTPFLVGSYLTVEEYRAAPTALQTNNLVPGEPQETQDAELAGIIGRASRKLDGWAKQPLWATTGAQSEPVRVKDGDAILRAHQDRVKAITSFAWGASWASMTTLNNPACFIEENRTRVALNGTGGVSTWSGALNINAPRAGTIFASWAYVAGWVTTRLAADATAGQTVITVENPTGIVAATAVATISLRLVDGAVQNTYQVASISGPVVTLTAPLEEDWPAGAGCSEVPDDLKEAAVLVVSHYIKLRSGTGLVMDRNPKPSKNVDDDLGSEMAAARETAERYMRKSP